MKESIDRLVYNQVWLLPSRSTHWQSDISMWRSFSGIDTSDNFIVDLYQYNGPT